MKLPVGKFSRISKEIDQLMGGHEVYDEGEGEEGEEDVM